jgi:stage II sporulation protein D
MAGLAMPVAPRHNGLPVQTLRMARLRPSLPLALALLAGVPLGLSTVAPPGAAAPQGQPEPQLRVLLLEAPQTTVAVLPGTGFRVRDRQGRLLAELLGEPLQLRLQAGWVELRPLAAQPAAAVSPTPPSPAAPLLAGPELWLEPLPAAAGEQAVLALQQRRYRGRLQVLVAGSNLQVINQVPLEAYLTSVVGSEMPASWPQEALRAQAVAARTYALKGRRPAAAYDLKATVASQVYRGIEAETASTRAAVAATSGLVLTYGSGLIDAVFHSSSGGSSTESSGDLWPQQLPYLVSVPDFDQESPVREWRQPLAADLLARAFAEIGGVRRLEVVSTTPTGRVRQARVVGPAGELLLSGASLRSRLGLKSTWVRFALETPQADGEAGAPEAGAAQADAVLAGAAKAGAPMPLAPPPLPAFTLPGSAFDATAQAMASARPLPLPRWVAIGRGFGHGIGMSQWGALAMARRGEPYTQILSHYYRGTQVRPYRELAVAAGPAPGPGLGSAQARDADAQVVARGPRLQP